MTLILASKNKTEFDGISVVVPEHNPFTDPQAQKFSSNKTKYLGGKDYFGNKITEDLTLWVFDGESEKAVKDILSQEDWVLAAEDFAFEKFEKPKIIKEFSEEISKRNYESMIEDIDTSETQKNIMKKFRERVKKRKSKSKRQVVSKN